MKWLEAPANASISHVLLGGSMMVYFDPKPFSEIRNVFTLLDLDTTNEDAQKKFIKSCEAEGIHPSKLKRYCIENYYTLDAIRQVFGDIVPAKLKSLDENVPPWKQLVDDKHDESWWKGELKSARRITAILENMNLSDIEGTDLLEFCTKIKSTL